ncbi:hypothetical protein ILUMI_12122, partial [Ignelater luminosus]
MVQLSDDEYPKYFEVIDDFDENSNEASIVEVDDSVTHSPIPAELNQITFDDFSLEDELPLSSFQNGENQGQRKTNKTKKESPVPKAKVLANIMMSEAKPKQKRKKWDGNAMIQAVSAVSNKEMGYFFTKGPSCSGISYPKNPRVKCQEISLFPCTSLYKRSDPKKKSRRGSVALITGSPYKHALKASLTKQKEKRKTCAKLKVDNTSVTSENETGKKGKGKALPNRKKISKASNRAKQHVSSALFEEDDELVLDDDSDIEEKEAECIFCSGLYSEDAAGEQWIRTSTEISTDKQTVLLRKEIPSGGVASEGEAVDREEKAFCVVCGMESTGAHLCDICNNPECIRCGNTVGEEGNESRIPCYLCQKEGNIKEQREHAAQNLKGPDAKMKDTSSNKFKDV